MEAGRKKREQRRAEEEKKRTEDDENEDTAALMKEAHRTTLSSSQLSRHFKDVGAEVTADLPATDIDGMAVHGYKQYNKDPLLFIPGSGSCVCCYACLKAYGEGRSWRRVSTSITSCTKQHCKAKTHEKAVRGLGALPGTAEERPSLFRQSILMVIFMLSSNIAFRLIEHPALRATIPSRGRASGLARSSNIARVVDETTRRAAFATVFFRSVAGDSSVIIYELGFLT